jgi:hypothetical protein
MLSPSPASLPCATSQTPSTPPWPSPSTAVPRHPDLLRARPQHRLASLILLADGIEPPWPETPSPSPFFPASTELRRRRLLAAGPSSGQAYLTGELRVSRRFSWTSSPPPCWPEPPPESAAGDQSLRACLPWPMRQRGLASGPRAPSVSHCG